MEGAWCSFFWRSLTKKEKGNIKPWKCRLERSDITGKKFYSDHRWFWGSILPFGVRSWKLKRTGPRRGTLPCPISFLSPTWQGPQKHPVPVERLFLREEIVLFQRLIRMSMDCSHGPNKSCSPLYLDIVDAPLSGMGPWWNGKGWAGGLPMHLNTVRKDGYSAKNLKESLMASSP